MIDDDGVRIVAAPTDHRPVEPTLGYRVELDGASVVIAGDTVPCAGLDELCRDADVYVQTVLRDDLVRMVPIQRFVDTIDYHSTVVQAAQTAATARRRARWCYAPDPDARPGSADEWVAIRPRALRRRDRLRPRPQRRPCGRRLAGGFAPASPSPPRDPLGAPQSPVPIAAATLSDRRRAPALSCGSRARAPTARAACRFPPRALRRRHDGRGPRCRRR